MRQDAIRHAIRLFLCGGLWLQGACLGLQNQGAAVSSSGSGDGGTDPSAVGVSFASLSEQCTGFGVFRSQIEGTLRTTCAACHATGGTGVGGMLVRTSGSESDSVSNYRQAMALLLADDGEVVNTNPLLAAPLGGSGHTRQMTSGDASHTKFVTWINSEYDTPCPLLSRGSSE